MRHSGSNRLEMLKRKASEPRARHVQPRSPPSAWTLSHNFTVGRMSTVHVHDVQHSDVWCISSSVPRLASQWGTGAAPLLQAPHHTTPRYV